MDRPHEHIQATFWKECLSGGGGHPYRPVREARSSGSLKPVASAKRCDSSQPMPTNANRGGTYEREAQGRDYYRPIREGIVTMHRSGGTTADLWGIVESSPPDKQANFTAAVRGYERWIRGKGIVWTRRPKAYEWKQGELTVLANPELLMNVNGEPYRVKLYLKAPKVTQPGANLVIHLHGSAGLGNEHIAVLDVRNGKLFTKTRTTEDYDTVLSSEALSFVAMWHAVGQQAAEGGAIS